jgi:hypothetical protein
MKRFSLPCMAVVLSLMLSASAFAGDIYIGAAPPPPPPPASSSATAAGNVYISGEIHIGSSVAPGDSASDIAFGLLQSLLSVF